MGGSVGGDTGRERKYFQSHAPAFSLSTSIEKNLPFGIRCKPKFQMNDIFNLFGKKIQSRMFADGAVGSRVPSEWLFGLHILMSWEAVFSLSCMMEEMPTER
ncbi:hypothetical protein CDAR_118111 [Caerostris darwini]|uniref:Uncharacterized protein n=1 Tax=Caerostris darwini TaxID=1538125 RepID=A0AAV4TIR2_9ARAC|nr:hypothetical protein CDAR_118111 [Caerostris darwini]